MTSRSLRALAFVVGALALTACASRDLGPEWSPLREIVESPAVPRGVAVTVGERVFVRDLDSWLAAHPEPLLSAVLAHEQVHAARQRGDLAVWLYRYATDPAFAWEEEQAGWEAQLRWLARHGQAIDRGAVARSLSAYRTTISRERLVSEADARAWVDLVLGGR